MTDEKPKRNFHEVASRLLEARLLKDFSQKSMDKFALQIYVAIFETLTELFQEVQAPLGNEAANYIAQQYYDAILVNKDKENVSLDPNIFTQRAKLENIPTKELAFMTVLFQGTDFRLPVLAEIKKRN